jgi:hypothetical protein
VVTLKVASLSLGDGSVLLAFAATDLAIGDRAFA